MAQFIISAIGSFGDVHPMVGLGSALAARGHRVKLITNPYFADLVERAGLELLPIGTREQYIELTQHPDLWHPLRGVKLVLSKAACGFLRPIYNLVTEHYEPGNTVLCAHALDLGSRVASEKLHAPLASVDFAPGVIWSIHDSPRLKGALSGPGVPKWLKRLQYWASDALFVQPLVGGELNGLRRELGLPPVTRVFGKFMHQSDLLLGLFPDWFGPPQPDWPATHEAGWIPVVGRRRSDRALERSPRFSRGGRRADRVFAGLGQPRGAAILSSGGRSLRADRPARHFADQVRGPTAGQFTTIRTALWVRAAESAVAANGRAGAPRRYRHLCSGARCRLATPGPADGVRPIRQFAAIGAAGSRRRNLGEGVPRSGDCNSARKIANVVGSGDQMSHAGSSLRRASIA